MRSLPTLGCFAFSFIAAGLSRGQEKVTYMDHVRPVLESRCLNCHNADKKKGGLDLSTYGTTLAGGSGGLCVEPGDVKSKLLGCVEFTVEPFMPPKSDKIPAKEIELIAKWIQGGLLETASSVAKKKKTVDLAMTNTNPTAKPEGPPPMPEHLLLEPVAVTAKPNTIKSMAHSPWAPLVAIAGVRQVLFFHADSRELLGVLPFPEGSPEKVGFSRNGSLIYAGGGTAGKKGIVAVWEVKTGKLVTVVGDETDSIDACDLSPDHKLVAIGGRSAKKVKILSTMDGSVIATIKKHTDWLMSMAFSPDGVLLATGDRNGGLYVWESATGNEFYNLKGHEKAITSVSWRPDSNVLASASEDGGVRLWEMNGGTQVKTWPGHSSGVLCVSYGTDGSLITSGRTGKIRVWNGDGSQKRELVVADPTVLVTQCGLTPDGKRLFTGDLLGNAYFWDIAKDPKELPAVAMLANPPSIASRLTVLQTEFDEKNGVTKKAQQEAQEKEKAMLLAKEQLDKAVSLLSSLQGKQTNAAQTKQTLLEGMNALKKSQQGFGMELEKAKTQLASLEKESQASVPVAAAEGIQAQSLQKIHLTEAAVQELTLVLTRGRVADLQSILEQETTQLALLEKNINQADGIMGDLMAKHSEVQQTMPTMQQALASGSKVYEDAKTVYDNAATVLAEVQKRVNRWMAAQQNTSVVALRTEVTKLTEQVEDLKTEIPTLESEIKALAAKKGATPPPTAEELAAADKKLTSHQKRLPEAQKELADTQKALEEKASAQQVAWKKYLEILPQ
jgi:hypothetical protein